jgi:hypothetical protein
VYVGEDGGGEESEICFADGSDAQNRKCALYTEAAQPPLVELCTNVVTADVIAVR